MTVQTFTIEDKPEGVLKENVNTLTLVRADPLASSLAPRFEALITDWSEVSALHIARIIAVAEASARGFYIAAQLDQIVDELVSSLRKITKKDRSDPQWRVFLGNQDVYDFKQPLFGAQLAQMHLWPAALAGTTNDELKAIGEKLTPVLPKADDAEADVREEKQKLLEFRNVGRWRQHIDKSNAERKAAFGFLSELRHKRPDLKLPSNYADRFFFHDTSRRRSALPTPTELDLKIQSLLEQIDALKQEKAEAIERQKAEEQAEAQQEAELAALAKAKEEEQAAKAKVAALKKELKKAAKK